MEEIYRDYSPNFCEISDNKPGFCLKIVNGWIQSTSFGKSSMFQWVLNTSLIMLRFFLLLLIEASTLNLSEIFLIWIVLYLSIWSRNFPIRCNKVMFETSEEQERLLLSSSGFFIDSLEHVYNLVGCFC